MARGSARPTALDQEGFCETILERMERHDHQSTAGLEQVLGGGQAGGELSQLLIDEDAQRLERPSRRMDRAWARMHDPGDDVGERTRRVDRRVATRGDDRAGNAARTALFAERREN